MFNLKAQSIYTDVLMDFDYILPGILAKALMQLGLFGWFLATLIIAVKCWSWDYNGFLRKWKNSKY